jgi:putative efflux protein, MATE family
MKAVNNFTEGKIYGPLIAFAVPIFMTGMLQAMYGGADMLIVGRFSNAAEVSAVTTGSMIMQSITGSAASFVIGTTIVLGRKIGEGREKEGGKVIGASIAFFMALGLLVTALTMLFARPIATIMQTPAEAFSSTLKYTMICYAGTVFIVGYNIIGGIFRGLGNSRLPLISVAIACVLNIIGDLILVGGFGQGAAGAAVATVISQALSVLISIVIFKKQELPFEFSIKDVRFDKKIIGEVFRLGIPIALQDMLICISFLVITAIVNSLGVIPSAGVGVAERICSFIMLVPGAFMNCMSAFTAQNMGARKPDRAVTGLKYAVMTSFAAGVVIGYVAFFHGDFLASLFSTDGRVIADAADYLKAYAIDCLLVAFMFCFEGFCNGLGKTRFVMIQGITGAFGVRVPVSYMMSKAVPVSLFKIGLATPCSTAVQIVIFAAYFFFNRKRLFDFEED